MVVDEKTTLVVAERRCLMAMWSFALVGVITAPTGIQCKKEEHLDWSRRRRRIIATIMKAYKSAQQSHILQRSKVLD